MSRSPALIPLSRGDVVVYDGREVSLLGRVCRSDRFRVCVDGGRSQWHVDRFADLASHAREIMISKRPRRAV